MAHKRRRREGGKTMLIYMEFNNGTSGVYTYDVFGIAMRDPEVVLIVDLQTGEVKKGAQK